jgi:uncharacterized membrane protein YadS
MLLVPFLLLIGQWWIRRRTDAVRTERGSLTIPWFALGFLAMVGFNSAVRLPASLHGGLVLAGQVALTMAMSALGYETRLDKLAALGIKPFALALCLFVLLTTGGLVAVRAG